MICFMSVTRDVRKKILSDIKSGLISLEEGVIRIKQLDSGMAQRREQTVYYKTDWQPADLDLDPKDSRREGSLLLFDTNEDLLKELTVRHDKSIILVIPGKEFRRVRNGVFEINPRSEKDYTSLFALLKEEKADIREAVHLWSDQPFSSNEKAIERQCDSGVYSLFLLNRAFFKSKQRKKVNVLYAYFSERLGEQPLYASASGFLRTWQQENPLISPKIIELERSAFANGSLGDILINELRDLSSPEIEIRYQGMERFVKRLITYKPANKHASEEYILRENGVYVITGGAGGLGFTFAEYLAQQTKCQIVLTGRSPFSDKIQNKIAQLEALGATSIYLQADISIKEETEYIINETKRAYGKINGIIQSAGIIRDSFLHKKTIEEFNQVIKPKVLGTLWLDEATKQERLDFFICFSSTSAVLGNIGQADYAFGNSYMDHLMNMRAAQNPGKMFLSLNWPLWKEVGMQVDERTLETMKKSGFYPLEKEEGIRAFSAGLSSGLSQFTVFCGDDHIDRHVHKLYERDSGLLQEETTVSETVKPDKKLKADTLTFIKEIISAEFRMPADKIDAEAALDKYGLDSVMIINITNELEKHFGALSKTLLFEFQTAAELSVYFIEKHHDALVHMLKLRVNDSCNVQQAAEAADPVVPSFQHKSKGLAHQSNLKIAEKYQDTDIAVIGISGRYPMANDLDTLWRNLMEGKDCITEIPKDRWDFSLHYQPEADHDIKNQSKWGGFIDDVYHFDPLFFNISPAEAELTDPQERIFLETVWHTIEDAGYAKKMLERKNVGVFAGVMYGQYQLYSAGNHEQAVSSSYASIANRVSYFFNFSGPSIALDTMCSSSLTAIHLACESLITNECELAIAGGVNLSIHPNKYKLLTQGGFLSSDGRCRSFGSGGDGYVPGEGAGAVLLKPVKKAIADGDQIYSIIKATAVNHGAKTNGYTVPNPTAQSKVISRALKKGKVDPESISYIEAHGTGTALGDPIEIAGLCKVFADAMTVRKTCAVGSIKSNIGHLEAAAGIAGITKVILQMKHKTIVPSLTHSSKLNEHIQFQETPFYVPESPEKWVHSVAESDGKKISIPRRAGISSFGAGGANAHIILEEYVNSENAVFETTELEPLLFVFSAKNAERLVDYAKGAAEYIQTKDYTSEALRNTAYTLQTGREEMAYRLAVVASSKEELIKKLLDYSKGKTLSEQLFTSELTSVSNTIEFESHETKKEIEKAIAERDLSRIAEFWISGYAINWSFLYENDKPRRISAPTYPFAKELCRISASKPGNGQKADAIDVLHPHINCNVSDFNEQKFNINVKGDNLYVKAKHNERMFPYLLQIEIARAAGEIASGHPITRLTNLSFSKPILQSGLNDQIQIVLAPEDDTASFFIKDQNGSSFYFSGKLVLEGLNEKGQFINIKPFMSEYTDWISGEAFYQRLAENGYDCSSKLRGIDRCVIRDGKALTILKASDKAEGYTLDPAVLESAYQTILCLLEKNTGTVPKTVEECTIFDEEAKAVYAYAVPSEYGKSSYHVFLLDGNGRVLVEVKGLTVNPQPHTEVNYCLQKWVQKNLSPVKVGNKNAGTILLFADDKEIAEALIDQSAYRIILVTPYQRQLIKNALTFSIDPKILSDYNNLFEKLEKNKMLPDIVLHTGGDFDAGEHPVRGLYSVFHLLKALSDRKNLSLKHLLITQSYREDMSDPFGETLPGYLKTINMVLPSVEHAASISFSEHTSADKQAEHCLQEIVSAKGLITAEEVKYVKDIRYVKTLEDRELTNAGGKMLKNKGVYMLTGGLGGLGMTFAKYLASEYKARLVLTGRSALTAEKQHEIEKLKAHGAAVLYFQADVTDKDAMKQVLDETKRNWGPLQGVIHAAGHADDRLFTEMSLADFSKGLAAKIEGTICLDQITKEEPLDFFVVFSSISSIFGDFGQVNYSLGNYFQDRYIHWRNEKSLKHERQGRSISINWPLWREGGMHLSKEAESAYLLTSGFRYLETEDGITAFEAILSNEDLQIAVLTGNNGRFTAAEDKSVQELTAELDQEKGDYTQLFRQAHVLDELKRMVSELLKINIDRLDISENFGNFGFDSISLKTLSVQINKRYKLELTPAIFFTYSNIESLSDFIVGELPVEAKENVKSDIDIQEKRESRHTEKLKKSEIRFPPAKKQTGQLKKPLQKEPIAIIGMSCVFPGAKNSGEFWSNLINEKDMIQEIPLERWDWKNYENNEANSRINSKWGGFITDVDKFDESFFNVNPREAELMDPQHRIYLEETWKAIEDAGYKASELSGKNIGVFTGIQFNDYRQLLMKHLDKAHALVGTGNSQALISNRVSHYFNLRGPSESIDTACSSSLVAIHRAVRSIQAGESELAVAGGVSLLLDPVTHLYTDKLGILSADGRCKTFDKLANGYVRGEGAAVLLLKPLQKAIDDKDNIYGVLKGTGENHGGRAASLTAPNPEAQAALLTSVYQNAGIPAETVSYIEAHGTGTELGDPIEIEGLKKAFVSLKSDSTRNTDQYCGIGSVKTNIGHLEPASGMPGLIKVLLAMKHKILPATLHVKQLNPYIQLTGTPFYIVNKSIMWNRLIDWEGNEIPRRAGVSSFGFGGTNAHVIVEEFEYSQENQVNREQEHVIVLSAKSKERLIAYAKDFSSFLKEKQTTGRYGEPKVREHNLREEIRIEAAKILSLDADEIDMETHLTDLGFDPMTLTALSSFISTISGKKVPIGIYTEQPTLNDLFHYICHESNMPVDNQVTSQHGDQTGYSLEQIAYTLQTGRESFESRLAIICSSLEELSEKINGYLQGEDLQEVFEGNARQFHKVYFPLFDGPEGHSYIQSLIQKRKLTKLAQMWTIGYEISWGDLYEGENKPMRLSLPVYPFRKNRHWIKQEFTPQAERPSIMPAVHKSNEESSDVKIISLLEKAQSGEVNTKDTTELIEELLLHE